MKIGIFDSGVGGLLVTRELKKALPRYDFIYLGDTKRVPYGERSEEAIFEFSKEAVGYLFEQGCALVIIACNTSSARALRRLQQTWLPKKYPNRRILGVIIPTVEEVSSSQRIGVLATVSTVRSKTFVSEIKKLNPKAKIYQQAAPLLVPLIENGALKWSDPIIKEYLKPLLKEKVDCLILGCTHYPVIKQKVRRMVGKKVTVLSQDEIVPSKLKTYLKRHPELEQKLTKRDTLKLLVTDLTPHYKELATDWFGGKAKLTEVELTKMKKK
jgi:glutamate racemase